MIGVPRVTSFDESVSEAKRPLGHASHVCVCVWVWVCGWVGMDGVVPTQVVPLCSQTLYRRACGCIATICGARVVFRPDFSTVNEIFAAYICRAVRFV